MEFETIIRFLGGLVALASLGVILYGVWRGSRRKVGRVSGQAAAWLRSVVFYLLSTALFLYLAWLGWSPLPLEISSQTRSIMAGVGSLLYFPSMALVLWGRLTLKENYFVSTGLGAQLFADQKLVETGPYAFVRHPMYLGLVLASLGALLMYVTWTTAYFAIFAPFLSLRAFREEKMLNEEFGSQWLDYCRRVPPFFPRILK